jgi:ankyrin repeat protein
LRRAQGRTALLIACEKGYTEIVVALLGVGSDVGVKDVSGVWNAGSWSTRLRPCTLSPGSFGAAVWSFSDIH